MKSIRFLAAGAALLLLASCGKEYNSVPGGNKGENPLLPLGTAEEAQIRYSYGDMKVRIYGAYRSDTPSIDLKGNPYIQRRAIGIYTDTGGNQQSFGLYVRTADSLKKSYTDKDSLGIAIGFKDVTDVDGSNVRVYTNYLGVNKSSFRVDFSELNSTTLRGSFSAKLSRWPIDSTDVIEIKNGTFWVKK